MSKENFKNIKQEKLKKEKLTTEEDFRLPEEEAALQEADSGKYIDKIQEELKPTEETREIGREYLNKEIYSKEKVFALSWYDDNKDKIRALGLSIEGITDDNKKLDYARAAGALKELYSNKEYQEQNAEIMNLRMLEADLKEKLPNTETSPLLFNYLYKQSEKIAKEAEMGAGAIRKILENMDLRQEAQETGICLLMI